MTGPYVQSYGDLDTDPTDTDRWADDDPLLCDFADHGDCDGDVVLRHEDRSSRTVLCDHHEACVRAWCAGIVVLLRRMRETEKELVA